VELEVEALKDEQQVELLLEGVLGQEHHQELKDEQQVELLLEGVLAIGQEHHQELQLEQQFDRDLEQKEEHQGPIQR
jgi:hypothetical protein